MLVVDDDPSVLLTVGAYARAAGLDAVTAPDAEQALRLLNGGLAPSLVVTDLELPGIDGLGLSRQIRAKPELSRTLIVMHSSTQRPLGNSDVDLWITKSHPAGLVAALNEFSAHISCAFSAAR